MYLRPFYSFMQQCKQYCASYACASAGYFPGRRCGFTLPMGVASLHQLGRFTELLLLLPLRDFRARPIVIVGPCTWARQKGPGRKGQRAPS